MVADLARLTSAIDAVTVPSSPEVNAQGIEEYVKALPPQLLESLREKLLRGDKAELQFSGAKFSLQLRNGNNGIKPSL